MMKLTLLGTGTPIPDPARRGPSQLVTAGNDLILVDAGSGVVHRLVEAGIWRPGPGYSTVPIRRIALTHLHSDHVTGLLDLLWTGWIMRWWDQPPPLAGPPGTAQLISGLLDAMHYDIRVREAGERLRREWLAPTVIEVGDQWTETGSSWRLSAFRVDHAPVDEAFGFRIDGDGGSIVISGDTSPCENLIRHAQDCDVLVHEVYWRTGALRMRGGMTDPDAIARRDTIDSYHTHSEDVGKVAAAANARHLVLSHILFRGGSPSDLLADIQPHYRGKVTVGEDLLVV